MVSEARVGYQRVRNPIFPDRKAGGLALPTEPAAHPVSDASGWIPLRQPSGVHSSGTPYDQFLFGQDTWNVNETVSFNRGRHFLKFGGPTAI